MIIILKKINDNDNIREEVKESKLKWNSCCQGIIHQQPLIGKTVEFIDEDFFNGSNDLYNSST